jgi:phage N-6-adenine-methyltransferase
MPAATQHKSKTDRAVSDNWRTPLWVWERATKRFGPFTLDAAADEDNHLCASWLGPGGLFEDALACEWFVGWTARDDRVWCNPPYSRGMVDKFLAKAWKEVRVGNCRSVTLLLPSDTSTVWWHQYIWDEQRNDTRQGVILDLLPQRVRFLRPDGTRAGTPPFGSALVHLFTH